MDVMLCNDVRMYFHYLITFIRWDWADKDDLQRLSPSADPPAYASAICARVSTYESTCLHVRPCLCVSVEAERGEKLKQQERAHAQRGLQGLRKFGCKVLLPAGLPTSFVGLQSC